MAENILTMENIVKTYKMGDEQQTVLKGIDLQVDKGEFVAILGPSGSGKSTLMNIITDNLRPTAGEVSLDGNVIWKNSNAYRARLGYMPQQQGLYSSFTGTRFLWYMAALKGLSHREAKTRVNELLELVNLKDAADRRIGGYSGGMKQRVIIAIALACSPKLLIADEPTTALDVTIQAQILHLMRELKEKKNTSVIMITHDLGIVAETCDRVAVMYAGKIIEEGTLDEVFNHTLHPYTEGLFNSLPNIKNRTARLRPIHGLMPDPTDLPEGCAFAPRCNYATEACKKRRPDLVTFTGTHKAACLAYEDKDFHIERGKKNG